MAAQRGHSPGVLCRASLRGTHVLSATGDHSQRDRQATSMPATVHGSLDDLPAFVPQSETRLPTLARVSMG